MKNNILLILAVTVISIGIIVATVLISGGGNPADSRASESTSAKTTTEAPVIIGRPTEETPLAAAPATAEAPETSAPAESVETSYNSDAAEGIIATAHSLIGIDFADGGDTPDGFDNSGFIYYVLRENGYITCPRGLNMQAQMGTVLAYEGLRKGDLVFFYNENKSAVGFGGIYCGDGIMIACLMPGTQVKEINITSPYYKEYFAHGISIT